MFSIFRVVLRDGDVRGLEFGLARVQGYDVGRLKTDVLETHLRGLFDT